MGSEIGDGGGENMTVGKSGVHRMACGTGDQLHSEEMDRTCKNLVKKG